MKTEPHLAPAAPALPPTYEARLPLLTLAEKIRLLHGNGLFCTGSAARLGIPPLVFSDGPQGVRPEIVDDDWHKSDCNDDAATYLPCPAALACTWNPRLACAAGMVLGAEARARGKDVILAPGVNLMRSPLCGRNFEYFSEDPLLAGKLGAAVVKGIQKNDVAACVKHFALNNQETARETVNEIVDPDTLAFYLQPFYTAITEGGALMVMDAYNKINGVYCCHNADLNNRYLKENWGFDGVLVSDWSAVHDAFAAAMGGLDVEMSVYGNRKPYFWGSELEKLVESGRVPLTVIDDKVRRVLRLMDRLHKNSPARCAGSLNTENHRQKALHIAEESIVLLKNRNKTLPLAHQPGQKIAVIGQNGTALHGDCAGSGGSAEMKALFEIPPLLGLRMVLGDAAIRYAPGYSADAEKGGSLARQAVELCRWADTVIFVGGLSHEQEQEGHDRTEMTLPYGQDELILQILAVHPDAVIALCGGQPVETGRWRGAANAILWYPYNGMMGGLALAKVLYGDVCPSGKLPVTFPERLADTPAVRFATACKGQPPQSDTVVYREGRQIGYRYYLDAKVRPAFCFGHGLSYTSFVYGKATLQKSKNGHSFLAAMQIKNGGGCTGKETMQLYRKRPPARAVATQELIGFEKVSLAPGEEKTVTFLLENECLNLQKGEQLLFGSSCEDIRVRLIF